MREKYESLSVGILKELAKARNIKHVSSMKKAEVVEAMLALDEKEEQERKEAEGKKDTVYGNGGAPVSREQQVQ